ncbi:MAG: TonB-dependent receptor plug domain-containing protein, partial [Cyclobacteriaceae bacterium]|nr:TonB-dependent receptor plug domain-containing protein [Cyclobacteriaceae bacterium]
MNRKLLPCTAKIAKSSLTGFVLHVFLVVLFALGVYAQQLQVKGQVTDENNSPTPGVNILIQGTTTGTVTDADGAYTINVTGPDAILIFSYIGYSTQEIRVGQQSQIDISLEPDISTLGEIVVTGYGTQKRSDLTGAITSIPSRQITELPLARTDQALQGRTSGVYVLNTDGAPGGETMIRIRGLNSINGGNEPLVILDGLQGGTDLLRALNPMDIESIEILKDASATAIYGSRGANGVIMITTKLGKKGKPVIDANVSVGVQELANTLNVLSAAQFANFHNLMRSMDTGGGNVP